MVGAHALGVLRRFAVLAGPSMPGSSRPSRNSSEAPPPVEMWVIRSARPCSSIAATESPPPTTTVAPARRDRPGSARSRACRRRSRDLEHAQRAVPEDGLGVGERLLDEVLRGLCRRRRCASWPGPSRPAAILYSAPRVTSLATTTSTGRRTWTPLLLGRRQDAPGVLDPVALGQALADGLALGDQERVGHAAADDEHVDLVEQVLEHLDLVANLGAADDRGERPRRASRGGCESVAISRSIRQPGVGRQELARRRRSRRGRGGRSRTRR